MSEVNSKDALREQARVQRKLADSLKALAGVVVDVATALVSSSDALVLLSGDTEAAAAAAPDAGNAPPATAARGRPRKATPMEPAAPPAAPAVATITFDQLKAAMQDLADSKGREQAVAVLQRNGIQRLSEAKPEGYAKLSADIAAAAGGKDATAASDDIF